jgi:CheY-like chemotaxis protein
MTSASRLAPARAPAVAAAAVPMPPPRPSRPFRLLLVEDHDDTASTMARLLAAEGYLVTRADSMQAALAAAEAGIDIMVSDLALPDGSGIDLLRLLRTRGFRAKAVCLSGYGSAADVRKSLEAGFAVHLTKPVDFDILRRTLLRVAAADPRKTNRARRSGAADRRR